jgi:hypothetical protein
MSESTVDRDPFERLAEEFAERLRRGEHPSLTEYIERYPEHADDIRDLFPGIALVEHYKPAENDLGISPPGAASAARAGFPDQLGDYRILRYLGEGGMGIVYEAVRESLRSHVALKVMHPQYRNRENYLRRFRTEARSAARLHHTNIVSVFDYGVHDGVCYYAMQYIAGQSLDKILADVRELRQEKEPSPAAETNRLTSDPDGPRGPGERDIPCGGGSSKTDPLRQTVTMGLLTGRWCTALPSGGSHDGDTLPPPTSSAVAGGPSEDADADPMKVWAAELRPRVGSTTGNGSEPAHTQAVSSEPGGRGSVRAAGA